MPKTRHNSQITLTYDLTSNHGSYLLNRHFHSPVKHLHSVKPSPQILHPTENTLLDVITSIYRADRLLKKCSLFGREIILNLDK